MAGITHHNPSFVQYGTKPAVLLVPAGSYWSATQETSQKWWACQLMCAVHFVRLFDRAGGHSPCTLVPAMLIPVRAPAPARTCLGSYLLGLVPAWACICPRLYMPRVVSAQACTCSCLYPHLRLYLLALVPARACTCPCPACLPPHTCSHLSCTPPRTCLPPVCTHTCPCSYMPRFIPARARTRSHLYWPTLVPARARTCSEVVVVIVVGCDGSARPHLCCRPSCESACCRSSAPGLIHTATAPRSCSTCPCLAILAMSPVQSLVSNLIHESAYLACFPLVLWIINT